MKPQNQTLSHSSSPQKLSSLHQKQLLLQSVDFSNNPNLKRLRDLIKDQDVFKSLLQEQEVNKIYLHQTPLQLIPYKQAGLSKQHRKLIKNMKMSKSSQACSICMQSFLKDQIIKKLPCSHILHKDCGKTWFKMNIKCPICRFNLKQHFDKLEKTQKQTEQIKRQKL